MFSITGKRIIVTGGARGMAAATVAEFVRQGARVAIFDVIDDAGEQMAAQATASGQVGSDDAFRPPAVSGAHYSATKGAVVSFSRAVAAEWARYGRRRGRRGGHAAFTSKKGAGHHRPAVD
jgi:NAD(P)-dependent dehydrogenase (short-subunit alcohol dehydrogenase family)